MNKLPKAVQEAAKRSEELIKSAAANEQTDENIEDNSTLVEDPVKVNTLKEESSNPQLSEDKVKNSDEEDFEHKYKVLQGKYNAETARSREQINKLTAQIEEVQKKVNDPKVKEELKEPEILLNPADFDEYGEQFKVLAEQVNELRSENKSLRNSMKTMDTKVKDTETAQIDSKTNTFYIELERKVSNWAEINVDENFLHWLGVIDPMTKHTRQDYLNEAASTFDSERAANIFNVYISGLSSSKVKNNKVKEVEKQVQPVSSKADVPLVPTDNKKIWRTSDIRQFYSNKTKKRNKNPTESQKKLWLAQEKDIFEAQKEGRIEIG